MFFNTYIFLLQQLDSIHVTILHKEEGAGLGFSLAGGADLENKVITVSGPVMGFIRARGNDPWRAKHLSGGGIRGMHNPRPWAGGYCRSLRYLRSIDT